MQHKWHYNSRTELGELVWTDGVCAVLEGFRATTFDALSAQEKAVFAKQEYDAEVLRRRQLQQNRGR